MTTFPIETDSFGVVFQNCARGTVFQTSKYRMDLMLLLKTHLLFQTTANDQNETSVFSEIQYR